MDAPTSVHELSLLLVEPSAIQARIIAGHLNGFGVAGVATVQSGREALAAMAAEPPDLVLSSMYLPDMTGTDLILAMRADPRLADLPFILISSEERPQLLDPVRQSGACAILPKPFGLDKLAAALRATLDWLNPDDSLEAGGLALDELRILVVDDSPMARRYIRHVLENLGARHFIEAGGGAEAAALLAEHAVDLVVTDYNMPEMDGKALIEYVRAGWQKSVPILMVTSETDQGRLAAVHNLGVVGVCDKPFEPATVKALLRQLLAT
ncbi:response regulator [Parasulfuritortus cantonensis]|uniref:Response regulator n=1 Tax=Parasulfuritortus cantonensis TaxID=2528202 RepID=A0A4R1BD44_9PROT|nr:response regulator [Parasulfuritortus cantonensis]TCJ15015.1 response regulator [Parasulfuritortus cantonensis]